MMWTCAACTQVNADAAATCEACGESTRRSDSQAGAAAPGAQFASIDDVPLVQIEMDDDVGPFKYVQIVVTTSAGARATLVRGHSRFQFHDDIFQHYRGALASIPGVSSVNCPGGGRMVVDAALKQIRVYGYSVGYGRAAHAITAEALAASLPGFKITWDNEGY
jgi:phosphohistidine phosphatase